MQDMDHNLSGLSEPSVSMVVFSSVGDFETSISLYVIRSSRGRWQIIKNGALIKVIETL